MKVKHSKYTLFSRIYIYLLALISVLNGGCGIYSFTGASISPAVKTISISYFPNNAQFVQPTLSQKFTDALRDKFATQTNLTLLKSGGDLMIDGAITGYDPNQPVAIQGGADQTASLYRLTVTVNVRFTNKKDDKQSFETSFSRYEDYDRTSRLADVEEQLLEQINEALVQDIFNKAVVNW
ncbi:MAG: LptE family protein [Bacteroidales bacterium]